MGTSGNPAKKAKELKISQVGDFKKRISGVFELPSGLVMRLKNPGGMQALMAAGLIPNSLMTTITESINKGKSTKPDDIIPSGGVDSSFLNEMTTMLNEIIVRCAVEPTVEPIPTNEAERLDTQLYADEIPDDDKMFVFQWLSGGTADLEKFREEHEAGLASVAQSKSLRGAAK